MNHKLLVATHNKGKAEEIADLLFELPVTLLTLGDVDIHETVKETGTSFEQNAIIKAIGYAEISGLLTLADDSGLEVDALHGQPGVRTARFGGKDLTQVERYRLLLRKMVGVPKDLRSARFRASIALAEPGRLVGTATGECEGVISLAPEGDGGFGYDPIFYLPQLGQTMAQLSPKQKHAISHRGQALNAILPLLRQYLADTD